jgi:hypothetical protein
MKNILVATLSLFLTALPAWCQTAATTPASPANAELVQQLKAMSPAERQVFLKNHPDLRDRFREAVLKRYQNLTPDQKQQFAQNHPQIAQRLSKANEAGATTTDPGHPRVNEVNQRETDQSQRIAQGVNSGTLTPQEDARLDKGAQRIQNREANDLVKNNGHLTPAEQLRLNRQENRESDRIYMDKHD